MLRWRCLSVLTLAVGLAGGCSREEPESPAASVHTEAVAVADDFLARLPREGGPRGFVGSPSCRSCHEDQFTSWHRSYHRTMTQFATPETVKADFDNVTLTNHTTRFHLSQSGDELWVRMQGLAETPEGEVPTLDTRMSLVTGSHHMQVFWVPEGSGNLQVGFPFTWLIPEGRWVPRGSTFIRPPGQAHQAEPWNVVCSRCHTTGVEPRVDPQRRTMDTRVAELGISCEACHGPGERHVEARLAAGASAPQPDAVTLAAEIIHPGKIDPARSADLCGFCHSMKWIDAAENWRQDGFRFRPGDALASTTPLIQPGHTTQIPRLQEFLQRNPTLLDDYFWPDGMGRVSGRELNNVVASPCFQGGKFSCLSCHSLHESEPNDLLAVNRKDNRACIQCHEEYREPAVLLRHTHHGADSSGSECYNCHMPHTTYGILSAIRSHQVSSPRVADELATGRPNACNLCHLDQTLAWTAHHLTDWYGQPVPELDVTQRTVADSVRLVLSGDAGQRALVAWHLGWPAAREASGSAWIPPVLGILLDDSYAAIRCVAERSLKATSDLVPLDYDYVIEPDERTPVWKQVWSAWEQREVGKVWRPEVLVRPGPVSEADERIGALLTERNERPVRLRE